MSGTSVAVRPARAADMEELWGMMREFAVYERLEHELAGSPEALARHVLGGRWPALDCLIAEAGDELAGFAVCFGAFSTFRARPLLWLEDVFVRERHRGRGVGLALMRAVAALALERGCVRVDWAVLEWNQPAIEFYRRLGATRSGGWHTCRLEGETLRRLAGGAPGGGGATSSTT